MTLTSRQKSYFVAPYLFLLCCSTYFQSSLKSQPIFSLATGLDRNHSFATTKNETLQSNFPVENLDNFGVFLFLYHFDAFFTFFKFFYLTIIYQKRASVPFIDGTLAL